MAKILAVATQGSGGSDETRLRELLHGLEARFFSFDRSSRFRSGIALYRELHSRKHELAVMEGTGLAGGCALLLARLLRGVRYVVSSGDAVGPFVGGQMPLLGPAFALYERLLCRLSSGYIGWTPYLAGRALTLGAPRAMTAAGWAAFESAEADAGPARALVREQQRIPKDAIVVGIAGSLAWNSHVSYCYGLELVKAFQRLDRQDVYALIVGGGSGSTELRQENTNDRVRFAGQVPRESVPSYLAAMDIASLPQSVDRVGSFRYTTKLSEYFAMGLPVVTGEIPLSYDIPGDWLWRLPGKAPWDPQSIGALVDLLAGVTREEIARKRAQVPRDWAGFRKDPQCARASQFVGDILRALPRGAEGRS